MAETTEEQQTISIPIVDENRLAEKIAVKLKFITKKEPEVIMTVDSLSEYLSMSHTWIYERVKLNEIPFCKMGNKLRFRKSEIDRWLKQQETPAINSAPLRNVRPVSVAHG